MVCSQECAAATCKPQTASAPLTKLDQAQQMLIQMQKEHKQCMLTLRIAFKHSGAHLARVKPTTCAHYHISVISAVQELHPTCCMHHLEGFLLSLGHVSLCLALSFLQLTLQRSHLSLQSI